MMNFDDDDDDDDDNVLCNDYRQDRAQPLLLCPRPRRGGDIINWAQLSVCPSVCLSVCLSRALT